MASHLRIVASVDELERLPAESSVQPLAPGSLAQDAPDAHWVLLEDGRLAARCSLWWRRTPPYPPHRLGLIGHYAARDRLAASRMLAHACGQLADHQCTLAVAPMDGSIWRRYRFVTSHGDRPPFVLEPDNPEEYPAHFVDAGFGELAAYCSYSTQPLASAPFHIEDIDRRLRATGIRIRSLDIARLDAELRHIHDLCAVTFNTAFLYTPIDKAAFVRQYLQILRFVRPELVQLAEYEGQLVGFMFALPDVLQLRRGHPADTVVLHSLAVAPERQQQGLGTLLSLRSLQAARGLGYTRAIFALVHEANRSRSIAMRLGALMRRYALFNMPLE